MVNGRGDTNAMVLVRAITAELEVTGGVTVASGRACSETRTVGVATTVCTDADRTGTPKVSDIGAISGGGDVTVLDELANVRIGDSEMLADLRMHAISAGQSFNSGERTLPTIVGARVDASTEPLGALAA